MRVVVTAGDGQWEELTGSSPETEWLRVEGPSFFSQHNNADAFFNLNDDAAAHDYSALAKPVFINAVTPTLKEIDAPAHLLRINGWNGFLQRPVWELAGVVDDNIRSIFVQLNKKITLVADEPGLVAARVIAMIINEAYFALGDEVSTKTEIDTAMKLGTNYPHGPFEWVAVIGVKNIHALLQKLCETDIRYQPAALLIKEAPDQ